MACQTSPIERFWTLAAHLLAQQLGRDEAEIAGHLRPEFVEVLSRADWPEKLRTLAAVLKLAWREAELARRRAGDGGLPILGAEEARLALARSRPVDQSGLSVADTADLLGLAHQRKDGNHWKTLRNAADKLTALCAALDETPPAALNALGPRWRQKT